MGFPAGHITSCTAACPQIANLLPAACTTCLPQTVLHRSRERGAGSKSTPSLCLVKRRKTPVFCIVMGNLAALAVLLHKWETLTSV